MSRRVLITGGAGFIGHHLASRMIREGFAVTVIDNEATGRREDVPRECRYIKGDVRSLDDLALAFDPTPDAVFHLAAQASNIRSFDDPTTDIAINLGGTVNVVGKCLEHAVPKLVYAGSMTEYGPMETLPVSEDTPLRPISYYGVSKTAAEHYVLATAGRPDLKNPFAATVFRMFNVYGPGQSLSNPYQGVLAIFIGQVLRGEPCTVDGDGDQTRDFVYIDDVAGAWAKAAAPGVADGASVNLGSGRRVSVLELVRTVCRVLGKNPDEWPIVRRARRPGDQRDAEADLRLARALIGWTPTTSFADGLSRTIAWAVSAGEGAR